MTCPCSVSRFRCSGVSVLGVCGRRLLFSAVRQAQNLDKPLQSIDEDITAFATLPTAASSTLSIAESKQKSSTRSSTTTSGSQDAGGSAAASSKGKIHPRHANPSATSSTLSAGPPMAISFLAELSSRRFSMTAANGKTLSKTLLLDEAATEIHHRQRRHPSFPTPPIPLPS